ncbi:hypothetical protein VPH35_093881 [Triticum aestivum]
MCVIGFWFFLPPGLDPRPSPEGKEEGEFSRRELQGWMAGQRSCPVGRGITECRSVGAEPAAVVGGEEGLRNKPPDIRVASSDCSSQEGAACLWGSSSPPLHVD